MELSKPLLHLKSFLKKSFHSLGLELRASHVNAYQDQKMILERFQEVKVIFDLGANRGETIYKYHNLFPSANIYGFEPFEYEFVNLQARYQNINQVSVYPLAVSNQTEVKSFFVNRDSVMNSLLPVTAGSRTYIHPHQTKNVECREVNTIALDDFCNQEKIARINILKMDIQGAELMALQGAVNLLHKQAIDLIYTEVNFGKLYEGQGNFPQVCQLLEQYNYVLYGLYDLQYGSNGTLGWGDAIFLSPQGEKSLLKAW